MFHELKPFQAPKSFKFIDPDTKQHFHAKTRTELIQKIVTYRAQNDLEPLEELGLVLENYWCSLPENSGKCAPVKTLKRGLTAYLRGGMALVKNLWYGEKNMVSQEEADRRAEICSQCKYNIFPDKTFYVQWADEIAQHSVGERKSKYHEQLGNCEVCSCPLRAKVWYGGGIELSTKEQEQMREVNCWQPEVKRG